MILSELLTLQERSSGASIGIEALDNAFYLCGALRLHPEQYLHHGDFCRNRKLHGDLAICIANKNRSVSIAKLGRSFCGCCPHGVWEYAHPVVDESARLVCILYYGYPPKPGALAKIPERACRNLVRQMGAFAGTFIGYELAKFRSLAGAGGKQHDAEYYVSGSQTYIELHYPENIGLGDLAKQLRINPCYLGAYLKAHTGKTFRTLLNERRLKEAEIYLKLHHDTTISQIAAMCGFADSNYFSTVFRKHFGMSPRAYRQ